MSDEKIRVTLIYGTDERADEDIVVRVEMLDRELSGHDAKFSVIAHVDVHDSRPVNGSTTLFEESFRMSSITQEFRIPRAQVQAYTYRGRMIDMEVHTKVVVNDAILFDTKVKTEHELDIGERPSVKDDAEEIIEPKDAFDFFKNLEAIPPTARVRTLGLLIAGGIVIAVNTLVGLHDQFSPDAATWFYSHFDSDGESAPPLVKSLVGSGGLGLVIWLAIRRQLRRYMQFSLRVLPALSPGRSFSINDLVRGQARVDLHDVTLRVVACNMECGQYRRGSGTDERTVSFREPTRALVLYERDVSYIPAKQAVASYFEGDVNFDPMFSVLYPPFMATGSHGLEVHWEVQLLHPDFVDQELVGPNEDFNYHDFLEA